MTNLTTIAGRVKATFGGLLFTAFSLLFAAAGIAIVVKSARQAATYLPATATVDKVTGADAASDKVTVAYSFSVQGRRYTGTESADDGQKPRFDELRHYKVGRQLTVYYDPRDPSRSQSSVKADASSLAFTIFAMPFLALGLTQLWRGLTGKELIAERRPNAQSDAVPGGGMFWVFVGTCVAGTIGQLALGAAPALAVEPRRRIDHPLRGDPGGKPLGKPPGPAMESRQERQAAGSPCGVPSRPRRGRGRRL